MNTEMELRISEIIGNIINGNTHPYTAKIDLIKLFDEALSAIPEVNLDSVPDLSTATEEEKETLVRGTMEAVAKPLLGTYVMLGLKTHMVAGVVNEATGELYEISFKKMPLPNPPEIIK